MRNLEIRRPKIEDKDMIYQFFEMTIRDTYLNNGIGNLKSFIEEEISDKKKYFLEDIESRGEKRFFLLALMDGQIVGTIAYAKADEIILDGTNGEIIDMLEIGSVLVHPDFQKQGIGSKLVNQILKILKEKGIEDFCLDSGYPIAQKIWTKKFGKPQYHLKNYWDEGMDHMIWSLKVQDYIV
jgi:predicted N-acetyltransferase YhbS